MKLEAQIHAIQYAIKELRKEEVKAKETNNEEWLKESRENIEALTGAIKTIQGVLALRALKGLFLDGME